MTRTELLAQADALLKKGSLTDEDRAKIDALLTQVEALDAGNHDAAEIRRTVAIAHLPTTFADDLIARGSSLTQTREAVFAELTRRSDAPGIDGHIGVGEGFDRGERSPVGLMAEALCARFGGPAPSPAAREQFMHMRAPDMARSLLERDGANTRGLSPNQLVQRALHTTADFPELLTQTGNRSLRAAYASYQGGVRRIARESTAPDFRSKMKLALGEAPQLVKVAEGGEVTRGTMAESKASYSLATYARIFAVSRQAIVNDDLGAFVQLTARLGQAAAEFVASQLAALLTSNPTMDDGLALFHANHHNLGTPAAIAIGSLAEALQMMRLQTGLDGVTPIDVTPKYLVVPAALEVVARQFITQINATKSSDVNPFSADLDVVVDPRLDANSATAWYLAADPNAIDTIEYSYLENEPGPVIETRAGFDVEGIEMKVRLDFGAGAIDHRGLFKNAGA